VDGTRRSDQPIKPLEWLLYSLFHFRKERTHAGAQFPRISFQNIPAVRDFGNCGQHWYNMRQKTQCSTGDASKSITLCHDLAIPTTLGRLRNMKLTIACRLINDCDGAVATLTVALLPIGCPPYFNFKCCIHRFPDWLDWFLLSGHLGCR
jgi:hypothetical protein